MPGVRAVPAVPGGHVQGPQVAQQGGHLGARGAPQIGGQGGDGYSNLGDKGGGGGSIIQQF